MNALLQRGRLFLAAACAMGCMGAALRADGNNVLGFFQRYTGKVDFAGTAESPAWVSYWVFVDTFDALTLPPGANVLSAHVYVWVYNIGALSALRFDDQPVVATQVGYGPGTRSGRWVRAYRSDVTSLFASGSAHSYRIEGGQVGGASLVVIFENPALQAEYDIEHHDGAHTGRYSDGADGSYWPNPTNFTGFTVDGSSPPEARLANFVGPYLTAAQNGYRWFNGASLQYPVPVQRWESWDVSALVDGGDTTGVANLGESCCTIVWVASLLRTRVSPIVTDTTPPEIAINSHAERAVVSASPAAMRVAVRDESSTTLSSTPALSWSPPGFAAPTEGESEAQMFLSEGSNPLTVRATDGAGLWSEDMAEIVLDTLWPELGIAAPLDGLVTTANSIELVASVRDATAVHVLSMPAGIDALLTPDPGGAAVPISGFLPLVEGPNLLGLTATDEALHASGAAVTVVRDTTPPEVTITSPPFGAVYGDNPATLTVQVVDATRTSLSFGGNAFVFDGGSATFSGDVTLLEGTPPAQPANRIAVTATDAAGNVTTLTIDLVLDLSAPIVTILAPPTGSIFGPGELPVEVTASVDDLTATVVSSTPAGIAGALPAGGGLVLGSVALAEGPNTISVRALDETLRSGSAAVVVVFDSTPPELAILSPSDGQAVRGAIDYDVTAVDPAPGSGVAQVELYADAQLLASFGAPPYFATLDTLALADGLHALRVRAVDNKGNERWSSILVHVDNTPPTLAIDQPVAGACASGTLSFLASAGDAQSGLVEVEMLVGGARPNLIDGSSGFDPPHSAALCLSRHDTTFGSDGPLMLSVSCRDEAGNDSTASIAIVVDNTAPQWSLVQPLDGSVVSGVIDVVAVANDPNLTWIELFVDGISIAWCSGSPCATTFDTRSRLDGAMTVSATAADLAGNISTCTAHVTVDNLSVVLSPQTLNLKSKGKAESITLLLEGPNLGLLMPVASHSIALQVAGATPVPASLNFAGSSSLTDVDGDGAHELTVKFDRQLLLGAIHAAIGAGLVHAGSNCVVTVTADGCAIGTDLVRILNN